MNKKKSKSILKEKKLPNRLALAVMVVVFLTTGIVFPQDAVTAKADDLQVPPPSFAKFDVGMTQTMLDIFNSPIMKAVRDLTAEEMGGYVFETLKISYFTTDRSIEEVTGYFTEKLSQEAEIETDVLVDSPEEMREMEEMTGLSWSNDFMDRYQKAHEDYIDEESRKATYSQGSFTEKLVTIEIESPYLDPSTFKKVNKTSIMYMVISFKKK
jgi:hypothetical protein